MENIGEHRVGGACAFSLCPFTLSVLQATRTRLCRGVGVHVPYCPPRPGGPSSGRTDRAALVPSCNRTTTPSPHLPPQNGRVTRAAELRPNDLWTRVDTYLKSNKLKLQEVRPGGVHRLGSGSLAAAGLGGTGGALPAKLMPCMVHGGSMPKSRGGVGPRQPTR